MLIEIMINKDQVVSLAVLDVLKIGFAVICAFCILKQQFMPVG
jgi:hypothetical protein